MNRENWRTIDKECTVCGKPVEVGSASARCSNRMCKTRSRDCPLDYESGVDEIGQWIIVKQALKDQVDLKNGCPDAEVLAARAMAEDPLALNHEDIGLQVLVSAAQQYTDNRPTTFISGHEFGWNCGQCSEIQWNELDGNLKDGSGITCGECGASYTVRLER